MVLLVIIAAFFFWSVKSGQMDDLEGPAYRILMDDDLARPEQEEASTQQEQQEQKERDKP